MFKPEKMQGMSSDCIAVLPPSGGSPRVATSEDIRRRHCSYPRFESNPTPVEVSNNNTNTRPAERASSSCNLATGGTPPASPRKGGLGSKPPIHLTEFYNKVGSAAVGHRLTKQVARYGLQAHYVSHASERRWSFLTCLLFAILSCNIFQGISVSPETGYAAIQPSVIGVLNKFSVAAGIQLAKCQTAKQRYRRFLFGRLSGNQGSWTNGDDMSGKEKKERKPRAKKTKEEKKTQRHENVKQLTKQRNYLKEAVSQKHPGSENLGKIIRGRGDYTMGKSIGGHVGSWIGDKLEGFVRKIFGTGDYSIEAQSVGDVQKNSLIAGSSVPYMHTANGGITEMCFHEFVTNIDMTTAFKVRSFPLDVSNPQTFPWLSTIAQNFQQYEMLGVVFFLVSLSSDAVTAPTQGLGSVFGAVRYDADSDPPTNKKEVLNSLFSSSAKPSQNQALPLECAKKMTVISPLKIAAQGTNPPDKQFYSMGWLDIATEGGPAPYIDALELHVTYHVRLLKPRIENVSGGLMYMQDLSGAVSTAWLTPVANTPAVKQPRYNSLGLVLQPDNTKVVFPLTTPVGSVYLYMIHITSGDLSLGVNLCKIGVALTGGIVSAAIFGSQTFNQINSPFQNTNTGTVGLCLVGSCTYNGLGTLNSPPTLKISTTDAGASPVNPKGTFFVIQINGAAKSGLLEPSDQAYTREEYFQYLCESVAGKRSSHGPPLGTRLVDWTEQFTKTPSYRLSDPLPSRAAFDQTFVEALGVMSKYVCLSGYGASAIVPMSTELKDDKPNTCWDELQCSARDCDCVREACTKCRVIMCGKGRAEKCSCRESVAPVRRYRTPAPSSDDDGYTTVRVRPQLNGSNGSVTGTDDVNQSDEKLASRVVSVNPPGLAGSMHPVRVIMADRIFAGWVLPEFSMVKTSVKNAWLWVNPMLVYDKVLRREEPVGIWTVDKLRKVQCYAQRGRVCSHTFSECPQTDTIVNEYLTDQPVCPNERLNGSNGSVTGTDDVNPDVKINPCGVPACQADIHRHPKKKADGPPAPPGAARRVAAKTAKQLADCRQADGTHTMLVNGQCPLLPGPHYHHLRRQLNAPALPPIGERDYEDMIEAAQDAADDFIGAPIVRQVLNRALVARRREQEEEAKHNFPPPPPRAAPWVPLAAFPPLAAAAPVLPLPVLPLPPPAARPPRPPRRAPALVPPPLPVNPGALVAPAAPPVAPPPPLPVPVAAPIPVAVAVAQQIAPGEGDEMERIGQHIDNLRNKAEMLWLHKNPASTLDKLIIVRSLTTIARKDEVYKLIPDIADIIARIVSDSAATVLNSRVEAADSTKYARRSQSSIWRLWRWIVQPIQRRLFYGDCQELAIKEAIEPFSLVSLTANEGVALAAASAVIAMVCALGIKRLDVKLYFFMRSCRHVFRWYSRMFSDMWHSLPNIFMTILPLKGPDGNFRPTAFTGSPEQIAADVQAIQDGMVNDARQIQSSIESKTLLGRWLPYYQVFCAPPFEEFIKHAFCNRVLLPLFCRISPRLKTMRGYSMLTPMIVMTALRIISGSTFGALESITNGWLATKESWRTMLIRVVFHSFTVLLGFGHGTFTHFMWNLGTIIRVQRQLRAARNSPSFFSATSASVNVNTPAPSVLPMAVNPLAILAIVANIATSKPYRSFDFKQKVVEDICLDECSLRCAPTQPDFVVKYGEAICEVGHGATGSWGIEGYVGTVFRSCHHNERISLCGRVGKFLPAHIDARRTRQISDNWVALTERTLIIFESLKLKRQYTPMDYDDWCNTFKPARRDMLLEIARDCNDMPALIAKSFIKKEICVKDVSDPTYKDPRWIQGCPPELSARVGPYLRPWAKNFKHAVAADWTIAGMVRGKQVVYTCGMNAQEIGAAFGHAIELIEGTLKLGEHVVFLEDDQSRFDLHLLKGPFHALNKIYRKYLPRRVANLLKRKLSRGTSNLGTKYKVPYTMQSGWPDTSLGDSITNAAMKYDIHGVGRRWISIICGDDSVTITVDSEIALCGGVGVIISRYADFGMEVEALLRENPLDAEFCSGRFFPCGNTFVLMPRTGKILSKICWDMVPRSLANRLSWLRSISTTMCEYGAVDPFMYALGAMLAREVGDGPVIDTKEPYKYYVVGESPRPSEFDVAVYFDHHYALSACDIKEMVDIILRSHVGDFLSDPRFCAIAAHDL